MNTMSLHSSLSRRSVLVAAGLLSLRASLETALPAAPVGQRATAGSLAGVRLEYLCAGDSASVAGTSLTLMRITGEPGAAFIARPHPGPVALYTDRGGFEMELLEGAGTVTRALVDETWTAHRDLSPGDLTRLSAGDRLFHDGAVHTVVNISEDQLVLLVATLTNSDVAALRWLEPV